ncbi:MAG: hypothetical protein KDA58_00370 [Planctomycetaceae bacterium]|nr:hypothetical protein [Planctomycetaceae bacterium]
MSKYSRRRLLASAAAIGLSNLLHPQFCLADVDEFCDDIQPPDRLPRTFSLPLPLFSAGSVWREQVKTVPLKANHDQIVEATYNMLTAEKQNFCYINFDDWTIPIFEADPGQPSQRMFVNGYGGDMWPSSTMKSVQEHHRWIVEGVPAPRGLIRPAGPQCLTSDGSMVLYDVANQRSYDFWQATTCREYWGPTKGGGLWGETVLEAGDIECFDVTGIGAQKVLDGKPRTSARATGVPLLAGLLIPEDLSQGENSKVNHPLVFSLPGFRVGVPGVPDFAYPASKTENSNPLQNPHALGAGERIRLRKNNLIDTEGQPVNESGLSPITQVVLKTLRTYGAYLVDGGKAFTFYAEDIHTAPYAASAPVVNRLAGRDESALIGANESRWEIVMQTLVDEIRKIPFAIKINGSLHANFEMIANAAPPAGF